MPQSWPVQYGSIVPVPFYVLEDDGVAPMVGLSFASGDIKISIDGAAPANLDVADVAEIGNGWYRWTPNAAQLNCQYATISWKDQDGPVFLADGLVIGTMGDPSAYFPTQTIDASVVEINGDVQSAADLKGFVDAGYDPVTNKVQGVVLVDTLTTNGDKTGYGLTSGERNSIADAFLARAYEGVHTIAGLYRLMASAMFGKVSGAASTTVTFRDQDDTKDRITATVDSNGNRTAVTKVET